MKMKSALTAAFLVLLTPWISQAADVGVSVTVGQPGFYGHIEIGSFPQPQLIYPEPVIIKPVPVGVVIAPVYIHVPPGHEKHWGKHCHEYNACGRPVYFVQDNWYNNVYVPTYQEKHGHGHDYDEDHDEGHGGKSHGHGHDHGKQH